MMSSPVVPLRGGYTPKECALQLQWRYRWHRLLRSSLQDHSSKLHVQAAVQCSIGDGLL